MKLALRILLSLAALLLLAIGIVYIDGATLPVDHTATVIGTITAPPETVFGGIVDVANGPTWRPAVKKVTVLPPDDARDHWIEDLGHGQTMTFLATHTVAPTHREVLLDVPGATYGGTWTYDVSPGPIRARPPFVSRRLVSFTRRSIASSCDTSWA